MLIIDGLDDSFSFDWLDSVLKYIKFISSSVSNNSKDFREFKKDIKFKFFFNKLVILVKFIIVSKFVSFLIIDFMLEYIY